MLFISQKRRMLDATVGWSIRQSYIKSDKIFSYQQFMLAQRLRMPNDSLRRHRVVDHGPMLSRLTYHYSSRTLPAVGYIQDTSCSGMSCPKSLMPFHQYFWLSPRTAVN